MCNMDALYIHYMFIKGVTMKIAIIGSRDITVPDLEPYLPENTTEIISGGARGADACAKAYALVRHASTQQPRHV